MREGGGELLSDKNNIESTSTHNIALALSSFKAEQLSQQ